MVVVVDTFSFNKESVVADTCAGQKRSYAFSFIKKSYAFSHGGGKRQRRSRGPCGLAWSGRASCH
jgi:hypothetical protein